MKKIAFFLMIIVLLLLTITEVHSYWINKLNLKLNIPVIYNVNIEFSDMNSTPTNQNIVNNEITPVNPIQANENTVTNTPPENSEEASSKTEYQDPISQNEGEILNSQSLSMQEVDL